MPRTVLAKRASRCDGVSVSSEKKRGSRAITCPSTTSACEYERIMFSNTASVCSRLSWMLDE